MSYLIKYKFKIKYKDITLSVNNKIKFDVYTNNLDQDIEKYKKIL